MKRGDAPDPEARGANQHPDDNTWLRRFFEWVLSDYFAHSHAVYLIEQEHTKLQQRRQWDGEAEAVRGYTDTLKALPHDPVATAYVRDMLRYEAEGKVVWTGDRWRKPARYAPTSRQPLTADQFLDRFEGVRKTRGGWQARCPAHQDLHPSLSIRRGDTWWLTHCHAGCSTRAICAAVGLAVPDLVLEGHDE